MSEQAEQRRSVKGAEPSEGHAAISRAVAIGFGVLLLFSTAISGLFGFLPILAALVGDEAQVVDFIGVFVTMPLFLSMAVVLGGVAVALLTYGFTGRRGSLLPHRALAVFGVVLAALLVVASAGAVVSGDIRLVGGAIEGVAIVLLIWRLIRSRQSR